MMSVIEDETNVIYDERMFGEKFYLNTSHSRPKLLHFPVITLNNNMLFGAVLTHYATRIVHVYKPNSTYRYRE